MTRPRHRRRRRKRRVTRVTDGRGLRRASRERSAAPCARASAGAAMASAQDVAPRPTGPAVSARGSRRCSKAPTAKPGRSPSRSWTRSASRTDRTSPTSAPAPAGSRCGWRAASVRTASSTRRTCSGRCSRPSGGASTARVCGTCGPSSATRSRPAAAPRELDAVLIVDAYHEFEQPGGAAARTRRGAEARRTPRHRGLQAGGRRPGARRPTSGCDEARVVDEASAAGLRAAAAGDVPPLSVPPGFRAGSDRVRQYGCRDPLAARAPAGPRQPGRPSPRRRARTERPARSAAPSPPANGASHGTPPVKITASPASMARMACRYRRSKPARGQPAASQRGSRVRHQVAASRAEQAGRALRQRRRCGEHRKAGETSRQVQELAAGAEPRARATRAPSSTITGWNVNGTGVNGSGTLSCDAAAVSTRDEDDAPAPPGSATPVPRSSADAGRLPRGRS